MLRALTMGCTLKLQGHYQRVANNMAELFAGMSSRC